MTPLRDLVPAPRGHVVIEQTDPETGALVSRYVGHNSFTDAYAGVLAKVCAAYTLDNVLAAPFTHVSLGKGGVTISDCENTTGWTGSVSADATTFTTGTASLKMSQAASTTATATAAALIGAYDATGASVELSVLVSLTGFTDLANTVLSIYTGGTTANGYSASLAAIQTAGGFVFQDGTWRLTRIAQGTFTAFGTPNWAQVTGVGLKVSANASGTATVNIDDVRIYPASLPTDHTQTALANPTAQKALTALTYTAPSTVTASAYWSAGELAGTFYEVGLWGNAGQTLVAIMPLTYTKSPNYNMTVSWSVQFSGG